MRMQWPSSPSTISPEGAQAAVDANVLSCIAELLSSPNASVRGWPWQILRWLADHETTVTPAVAQLVSLLRGGNLTVTESAAETLYYIAKSPKGAQAAVDANVLTELFSSPNTSVQKLTRDILKELVRHETTVGPAMEQLVSLLRGENIAVIESVAKTLYRIATSPKDAQAAVHANVLEYMAELLSSPNTSVQKWTREILEEMAHHETTIAQSWDSCGDNIAVIESVAETLYRIATSSQGAQAAVDANVLEYMAKLLSSPNTSVQKWTFDILRELARHETAVSPAVGQMVSLLRGGNPTVVESVAETLYWIATSLEGAQAAVDANVLDWVAELLSSPNTSVWQWSCKMLGQLARHETTVPAVLSANPCQPLVSPFGENLAVIEDVTQALYRITTSREGAQAAMDANVLDYMAELLSSPNISVQKWTCDILRELARHETTVIKVEGQLVSLLRGNPTVIESALLVSRLCGGNPTVSKSAAATLYRIVTSSEGAQAAVDANVLECMAELLSSPKASVRRWSCKMLGQLVCHKSTVRAVMSVNPCQPLVSLLHGGNLTVSESAAATLYLIAISPEGAQAAVDANVLESMAELLSSPKASSAAEILYRIAKSPKGAQAAVDANVLECMAELLSSPNASVWHWTRCMLGQLACHKSTTSLAMNKLVSLLRGGNPTVINNVAQVLYQVYTFPETAQAAVDAKVLACMAQPLISLLRDEVAAENAIYAIYKISRVPDGAQAVFDAKLLGAIAECLQSPSLDVQERACQVIGNLAALECIAPAIIELNLAGRLVYLLHWRHEYVISQAMYALSRITRWVDAAHAIVEAKALDHLLVLLREVNKSYRGNTRRWACDLIGNLTQHESSASTLQEIDPCRQLIALLQVSDTDSATRTSAGRALARISERPNGVAAIMDSGLMQALLEMNENEQPEIRTIRDNIARIKNVKAD
ncbi:armadillo-type protein [Mycena capillaripes]|nr:armadillo-type protein [Mycena capillaripes]